MSGELSKKKILDILHGKICSYCHEVFGYPQAHMMLGDHGCGWRCSSDECSRKYDDEISKKSKLEYELLWGPMMVKKKGWFRRLFGDK
jgi:hypothetical protein